MTDTNSVPNPGEARTRQRQRRQLIYVALATLAGGAIGFFVGFFDQGDGNLFGGDWDKLALDPTLAILLAIGVVGGFGVLPLWGFTQIDDFQRAHNLVAFTGGSLAVLAGFPCWALLYAGGFAPPPHAFGVWLIGFASMIAAYGYARWFA